LNRNNWAPPNTGATNESGFTGLPGGQRYPTSGWFDELIYRGFLWSSTESGSTAIHHWLFSASEAFDNDYKSKEFGIYIRCLKN